MQTHIIMFTINSIIPNNRRLRVYYATVVLFFVLRFSWTHKVSFEARRLRHDLRCGGGILVGLIIGGSLLGLRMGSRS